MPMTTAKSATCWAKHEVVRDVPRAVSVTHTSRARLSAGERRCGGEPRPRVRTLPGSARRAPAADLVQLRRGDGRRRTVRLVARDTHGGDDRQQGQRDRAGHAPDADRLDREQLAIGQVGAEAAADEGEGGARQARGLARHEQAGEDRDVGDQPEQGHRHAGQARPLRGLNLLAPVRDLADGRDAGVMHVGEVAGDRDAQQGERRGEDAESVGHGRSVGSGTVFIISVGGWPPALERKVERGRGACASSRKFHRRFTASTPGRPTLSARPHRTTQAMHLPPPSAVRRIMSAGRRSAVAQFVLSGLLAMAVIAVVVVGVSRHTGTSEAIRDARELTRVTGDGIVAPALTPAMMAGDQTALKQLNKVICTRVRRYGIVRVKLWDAAGRVVYSDEPRLIGRRFGIDEDQRSVLESGHLKAEVTHLPRNENSLDRPQRKLLEVYAPIRGPRGEKMLFEAYHRYAAVSASGHRLWTAFAPALLGGLLLLQLVNLPLAGSLARRLRHGQREREVLLRRALDDEDPEGRTIGAALHDGVVQDFAGVGFTAAAHADPVNGSAAKPTAAPGDAAAKTRHSVRALRTLLVDIYPRRLHAAGLAAAVNDLASTYTERGLTTTIAVPADLELSAPTEQLLFRCAQEALRNTQKHARAASAAITVQAAGEHVMMDVRDDGAGFDRSVLDDRRAKGHFGVWALGDLVRDAGGQLDLLTVAGGGTTLRVRLRR